MIFLVRQKCFVQAPLQPCLVHAKHEKLQRCEHSNFKTLYEGVDIYKDEKFGITLS